MRAPRIPRRTAGERAFLRGWASALATVYDEAAPGGAGERRCGALLREQGVTPRAAAALGCDEFVVEMVRAARGGPR